MCAISATITTPTYDEVSAVPMRPPGPCEAGEVDAGYSLARASTLGPWERDM